ncbi:MAG: hypothetical protein IJW58_04135 [Clostridia bacterium]|nr:hypothetical protein [Clostridia bacterium]
MRGGTLKRIIVGVLISVCLCSAFGCATPESDDSGGGNNPSTEQGGGGNSNPSLPEQGGGERDDLGENELPFVPVE